MGAYLGVARGSETPPQFIHLTYTPPDGKVNKKVGVVGKGLLFDTGGYNIKVGMMELMKFDCGGAAAVLGTLYTSRVHMSSSFFLILFRNACFCFVGESSRTHYQTYIFAVTVTCIRLSIPLFVSVSLFQGPLVRSPRCNPRVSRPTSSSRPAKI